MLSQRLVRATALRSAIAPIRRLPIIQQRTFLPASLSDRKILDEKFPEHPTLSEAEDPEMVGYRTQDKQTSSSDQKLTSLAERRIHQPPSHQAPTP
jgi:hypothetical protein